MAPALSPLATSVLPSHSRSSIMSSSPDAAVFGGGGSNPPGSGISNYSPPGSPRSASVSLQAAAAMNAGLQREDSRRSSGSSIALQRQSPSTGRRRSTVLMNLHLNDPSVPGPGEMAAAGDGATGVRTSSPHSFSSGSPSFLARGPYHARAPSLGELHQELEAEQEGQVNRLLQKISQYQAQVAQLQAAKGASPSNSDAVEDSERSTPSNANVTPHHYQRHASQGSSVPLGLPPPLQSAGSLPRSPVAAHFSRSSLNRKRSRTPSRTASPRLRSTSMSTGSVDWNLGGRDESAYFQAETLSLTRENQMLKHRIRELEKQLAEFTMQTGPPPLTHEPSHRSRLSISLSAAPEFSVADEQSQQEG